MNSNDHQNQIYRIDDILDEKIMSVIRKIKSQSFLLEAYQRFSYSDVNTPLGNGWNFHT